MAQRICRRHRIVSPNFARSCKYISLGTSFQTSTALARGINSSLTPFLGSLRRAVLPVISSPVLSAPTMSVACGKRCKNSTLDVRAGTQSSALLPFDAQILTPDHRLPTHFRQHLTRGCWSQRLALLGDWEPAAENHQNLCPLLSSTTVIKYSSQKERGRTTTSTCFKRTAP